MSENVSILNSYRTPEEKLLFEVFVGPAWKETKKKLDGILWDSQSPATTESIKRFGVGYEAAELLHSILAEHFKDQIAISEKLITLIPGKDYEYGNKPGTEALNLNPYEVIAHIDKKDHYNSANHSTFDFNKRNEVRERVHEDGWTIKGKVEYNFFAWVNYFEAVHQNGWIVQGDFEDQIQASSREAFDDFMKNHAPESWDYGDI